MSLNYISYRVDLHLVFEKAVAKMCWRLYLELVIFLLNVRLHDFIVDILLPVFLVKVVKFLQAGLKVTLDEVKILLFGFSSCHKVAHRVRVGDCTTCSDN